MPRFFKGFGRKSNRISEEDNGKGALDRAENRMVRVKALAVIVGLIIFAEGSALIYFVTRYQKVKETTGVTVSEKKDGKTLSLNAATDVKYRELLSKFEAVKADRDNLLKQAKRYFTEEKDTRRLEEFAANLKEHNRELEAEAEEYKNRYMILEQELARTAVLKEEMEGELENLEKRYSGKTRKIEKSKYMERIDDLQTKIVKLNKEKRDMEKEHKKTLNDILKDTADANVQLNQAERELERIKKEKEGLTSRYENRVEDLESRLKDVESEYAEATKRIRHLERVEQELASVKASKEDVQEDKESLKQELAMMKNRFQDAEHKNELLADELEELPRRFSELSQQNTRLLKETAEMHYNLGVFYSKNKEYDRAIAEFSKAVESDPADAQAHFNLGYLYAECTMDREKAVKHFRQYLNLAKSGDRDIDWAKKYLLTWETFEGKTTVR